jgi:pimeloyl-ACP methyl ester carboxylesterase
MRTDALLATRSITPILLSMSVLGVACPLQPRPEAIRAATSPEEMIFARSKDDVINAGVLFTPPKDSAKAVAIIWIHGWGVNFYQPSYVAIGRELAERGYLTISANTRMHDLGNVETHRGGKRIRGGGYWGIASDEVRDLAAWVDAAEQRGFKSVVLVGHSAGWAAVRRYASGTQDPRVVGVVLASGAVRPETRPTDPDQLRQAEEFMAKGEGDAMIRDPKRDFPSYISASTFLDIANAPPEYNDFFGVQTPNAGIARVHCALLAFFGDRGDVGTEEDLDLLKSAIARQKSGPIRVTTAVVQGADHMYTGEEKQVAQLISDWARTLPISR